MSLRLRIVFLVMLATFMPAALFGLFALEHRDRDIVEAKQSLHALAVHAAESLGDKVDGTVQMLQGLSRAQDLDAGDKAACSAFLGDVLRRSPQYTGLLTIRPDGQLHCDSLASGRTLDLNDRPYFKRARDSKEPAFEVVFGRLTGIAVLQVAFPARDSAGRLKYVLLASLNLAQFAARFATASPYKDMEMIIWDGKGTLMVRQPDGGAKKLAGSAQPASALFRFVGPEQAEETAELPGPDGSVKIWARGVLPVGADGGLRFTLGIPGEVLHAETDRTLRRALTTLATVTLLVFFCALLLAELGIRRQVVRIMSAATQQGAGDLGVRIGKPYPRGELGDLMARLDTTAAAVQAQQLEIERRAKDLARSNRTLRVLSAINSAIVRVHDRDKLLAEACRIAVEEGRFPIAWAGLLDRETRQVKPVAWQGVDKAYVDAVPRSTDGESSLVGRALRDLQPIVVNDIAGDSRLVNVKMSLALGSRALAVFPLVVSGAAVGVLVLHSREAGFFDQAELKLLMELAGDVAFALDYIGNAEKLDYLAYYDAHTGLANRVLFLERVAQHVRSAGSAGHRLAVFLLDLRRFKDINDTLGRSAGDALLKQVAHWLTQRVGDASLLARVGADQFAVVLPEVKSDGGLARLLEKALDGFLDHPFRVNDTVLRIGIKVGVALFPGDGADADALLRNAEAALKKAKASGDRYLFYTQKMTEAVASKLAVENRLRQALDGNEFVLHYQPKVSLASGLLTSAEALLGWNDPLAGRVPASLFMPILEEIGLIHDVGRWVLRKVIEDHLRWRKAGLRAVRIMVNVSPLQLRNRGFAEEIRQATSVDPAAPAGLGLEISEGLIMADVEHSIASLQAIRAMGVSVAIDDFGTGVSSLSHLAKLPVDTLNIAGSIVLDMTSGPQGLALVSTIINLAHALQLKVVAAGVQTEEQARLLRLLGCDEMQGELFSAPLAGELFEARYLAAPAAASGLLGGQPDAENALL
jgi:diguanylate cyclase (GGDEF)-like protein